MICPEEFWETETCRFWSDEDGILVYQVKSGAVLDAQRVASNAERVSSQFPGEGYRCLVDARETHRMSRAGRAESAALTEKLSALAFLTKPGLGRIVVQFFVNLFVPSTPPIRMFTDLESARGWLREQR